MNAKLLFAATVALSIASTYAMADEPSQSLTRAEVVADLAHATAAGTLRKSDYDYGAPSQGVGQANTRDAVLTELAVARSAPKLLGSLSSRTYNPFGSDIVKPSVVSRSQVRYDLQQAIASGTLQRSDYDFDSALVARRINAHMAAPILARAPGAATTTTTTARSGN